MPEHFLKWLARTNVVCVEEDIKARTAEVVMKLDSHFSRIGSSIADKNTALLS
jgi:hypothetical protein